MTPRPCAYCHEPLPPQAHGGRTVHDYCRQPQRNAQQMARRKERDDEHRKRDREYARTWRAQATPEQRERSHGRGREQVSARARYVRTAIDDDNTRRADVGARQALDAQNVPNEERPTHLASKEQRKRDEAAGLLEHPRRRRHR